MKRRLIRLSAALIILGGALCLAYPSVSSWFNQRFASHIAAQYESVVNAMDEDEVEALFDEAYAFNRALREEPARWELPGELKQKYYRTLDVSGTGIMGTVYIPDIGITAPVYHGDKDTVLQIAAGHMEGSSFPTGEAGTHGVIAAHTGMASAKLFTELGKLKDGDMFYIRILDRTLSFTVISCNTVLPDETELLDIPEKEGLVTLVTCTPFGVNSHRLLVTGRYAGDADTDTAAELAAQNWFSNKDLLLGAAAVVFSLSLIILVKRRKQKSKK